MITAKANRKTLKAVKKWLASGRRENDASYFKMSYYVGHNSDRYARRIQNAS